MLVRRRPLLRTLLVLAATVLLLGVVAGGCLWRLVHSPDALRWVLVRAARARQIELQLARVELLSRAGEARLSGVELRRTSASGNLSLRIRQVNAELDLWALLFGRFALTRLELERPEIMLDVVLPSSKSRAAHPEPSSEPPRSIRIDELRIRQAQGLIQFRRSGGDRLGVKVREFEYQSSHVQLGSISDLLGCARCSGVFEIGAREARFERIEKEHELYSRWSGIDASLLNYLWNEGRGVHIDAGTLDILHTENMKDRLQVRYLFQDLSISAAPRSKLQDRLFVAGLEAALRRRGGTLDFNFRLSPHSGGGGDYDLSRDLQQVVDALWKTVTGMLIRH